MKPQHKTLTKVTLGAFIIGGIVGYLAVRRLRENAILRSFSATDGNLYIKREGHFIPYDQFREPLGKRDRKNYDALALKVVDKVRNLEGIV